MGKKKPSNSRQKKNSSSIDSIFETIHSVLENIAQSDAQGFESKGELGGEDSKIKASYSFRIGSIVSDETPPQTPPRKKARFTTVVKETIEPSFDLIEELDHLLLIVEMPGISSHECNIDINGDLLIISAKNRDRKYYKEILLPRLFSSEQISVSSNNSIFEIRCKF
jgi:HSP20 family protein